MLRIVAEVVAATLTASALLMGHVRSETVIPAPVTCVTENILLTRLKALRTEPGQTSEPRYVLRGKELELFKQRAIANGGTVSDDDEIMIFDGNDPIDEQMLFITFKNGCVTHAFIVPEQAVRQLMKGS